MFDSSWRTIQCSQIIGTIAPVVGCRPVDNLRSADKQTQHHETLMNYTHYPRLQPLLLVIRNFSLCRHGLPLHPVRKKFTTF